MFRFFSSSLVPRSHRNLVVFLSGVILRSNLGGPRCYFFVRYPVILASPLFFFLANRVSFALARLNWIRKLPRRSSRSRRSRHFRSVLLSTYAHVNNSHFIMMSCIATSCYVRWNSWTKHSRILPFHPIPSLDHPHAPSHQIPWKSTCLISNPSTGGSIFSLILWTPVAKSDVSLAFIWSSTVFHPITRQFNNAAPVGDSECFTISGLSNHPIENDKGAFPSGRPSILILKAANSASIPRFPSSVL